MKRYNIWAKRKALGYSQEDVAKKVKITKQHVSDIENGKKKPSLDVALDIAKVLDGTVEFFFGRESA